MRTLLTLTAGATLALTLSAAEIGQPAPDFTAKDIDGRIQKLSDYAGKIVVLEAYNLDCPYCANHFKTGAMQELQAELTDKGIIWLLVNSVGKAQPSYRSPEKARAEWAKLKIQATAWIDDSAGTIGHAYGLRTTPHMVVIDKQGNIAYDGAVDDRASSSGDPRSARNYVREAVNALLSGEPVKVARTKSYGCGVKYGS